MIFLHALQLIWSNECNYPMAFVYFIGGHAVLFYLLVANKMASFKILCVFYLLIDILDVFQRMDKRAKMMQIKKDESFEIKNDKASTVYQPMKQFAESYETTRHRAFIESSR